MDRVNATARISCHVLVHVLVLDHSYLVHVHVLVLVLVHGQFVFVLALMLVVRRHSGRAIQPGTGRRVRLIDYQHEHVHEDESRRIVDVDEDEGLVAALQRLQEREQILLLLRREAHREARVVEVDHVLQRRG